MLLGDLLMLVQAVRLSGPRREGRQGFAWWRAQLVSVCVMNGHATNHQLHWALSWQRRGAEMLIRDAVRTRAQAKERGTAS